MSFFGLALIFGQCRRVFHKIEHCAAVPTAGQGKRIQGFRDKLEIEAFRAFMAQLAKILLGKGAFRRRTWSLESSCRVTLKEGFSVVVASRVSSPDSSRGRKKSCWAFENLCSSSRTSTSTPARERLNWASPASGAESRRNFLPDLAASNMARVDLPQPGGPKKHAWQAVGLLQGVNAGAQLFLPEKFFESLRTQGLRQRDVAFHLAMACEAR